MSTIIDRLRQKSNRTLTRIAVLLGAAMVAVFALPSAAMAEANFYEDCPLDSVICTFGTRVGLPQGVCETTSGSYGSTQVCIDYASDTVYVKDGRADGEGAVALVWSSNGVGNRYCANNQGSGTWVKCDFDWTEAGFHAVAAGYIADWNNKVTYGLWNWYDN